jgi:xylulokinase
VAKAQVPPSTTHKVLANRSAKSSNHSAMSYLAGIDLGSTSLKVVIYDLNGRAVAQASRPTELVHPDPAHPDWAIWRPEQIWAGVADSLRESLSRLDDSSRIKAVAVTGMGMDGLPIDRAGNWLYPLISWHCPRTIPQQQWWLENVGAEKQFAIGGNPVWPSNPVLRMMWLREHEPDIYRQIDKWLLIEDFINYMLCGVQATDFSMASCTLLFDQTRRDYSEELLRVSGIDRALLCDVKPSGTVIGAVHRAAAEATGLAPRTPVVLGGHDFLCGALPVGAFRPGVVLNVAGTWEMMVTALDCPVLKPEVGAMGGWIDSHVARGKYAAIGCVVAADMLEWFRKQFCLEEAQQVGSDGGTDWNSLMALAQATPAGAGGVMFLPHMSGSTVPVIDPSSMGAFIGLRNVATKGHLLRAMIEGLDFQFRQMIDAFGAGLGIVADSFVSVGGGANNAFWMQTKADVMGKPFETPEIEEATPLGAAILAGIGVGLFRDEQEAFDRVYRPGRVFEPDLKLSALYTERYEIFKQLYPALKEIHTRLRL